MLPECPTTLEQHLHVPLLMDIGYSKLISQLIKSPLWACMFCPVQIRNMAKGLCKNPGLSQAASVARLEGAWEHKEAEAARVEGSGEGADTEQQTDAVIAAESTAKMKTPLGPPARKRSRLHPQAAWQPARALSPSSRPALQQREAQGGGSEKDPAEADFAQGVTVR